MTVRLKLSKKIWIIVMFNHYKKEKVKVKIKKKDQKAQDKVLI